MSHTSPSTLTHTVLFVDDDLEALDTWAKGLQECSSNYTVLKAETVECALDFCGSQKIDCVVLDLDVGRASGFEVLLSLSPQRNNRGIVIVVLTRLTNPSLHQMVVENGAYACLVKGRTSPSLLHNAIQTAIATAQGHAH